MSDLTHLQQIRQELPAVQIQHYLNTGTFGPLPTIAIRTMQERLQRELELGRLGAKSFEGMSEIYNGTRQKVARFLHATEEEITLTDNTGEGLNIVSYGLNWQEGDEVITTNHEHISALAPLYQLRDRYGIVIRKADLGPQADWPVVEALQAQVTPRTRLISISHVTWTTGAVIDIQAVAQFAHERGILVLIDGAQSAGAIALDVKKLGVDFYALPMQKWLCGPDGTGALYVSDAALNKVHATYVGYWSIKHEDGVEWVLHERAQRFELGGRQTAALSGQSAVLGWLEDFVGYTWMFERISQLNGYAFQVLKQVPGLTLLTPKAGASGILAFTIEGKDEKEIVKTLSEQHSIQIRSIPETHALRVSTGFYNTEEEIDLLAQALQKM
ncbi:MAG TPA: aminotransferase class V-fold PLP-dependent enzyme [Ktedonobacteraceae bacterium]